MNKSNRIIVLVDDNEKATLEKLANKMARSNGETMRIALKELNKIIDPLPRDEAILYERD